MPQILIAVGALTGLVVPVALYFGVIHWREHRASFVHEERLHATTGEFPQVDFDGLLDPKLEDTGEWLRIAHGHPPTGTPSAPDQFANQQGGIAVLERPKNTILLTEQTPTGTHMRPEDMELYNRTAKQPALVRPYVPPVAAHYPPVSRDPQRAATLFVGLMVTHDRHYVLPEPPLAQAIRAERAMRVELLGKPLCDRYEPELLTPLFNQILDEWRNQQD